MSGQDVGFSEERDINSPSVVKKNPYGKKIKMIITFPNGSLSIYDPLKEDITYQKDVGSEKKLIKNTNMPSDPLSGKARLNEVDPRVIPEVLPRGYNGSDEEKFRKQYQDVQKQVQEKYKKDNS